MGICSSSNTNSVSNVVDITNVEEVDKHDNIDVNSNHKKESFKEPSVLKLLDGHYNHIFGPDPNSTMVKVKGDQIMLVGRHEEPDIQITATYRQFEEIKVDPIIVKETGQNTYNVKFSFHFGGEGDEYVEYGIISEDRLRVACGGSRYGFSDSLEWVDEEMAENILKLPKITDPIEAPSCPFYKMQPENQGILLFISGVPGTGKSTSAQFLAREFGFVYYETDCFYECKNPYIPPNVENPSVNQVKQRDLIGTGVELRRELIMKGDFNTFDHTRFEKEFGGKPDKENVEAFELYERHKKEWDAGKKERKKIFEKENGTILLEGLLEDISKEKKRIGGSWAIAGADLRKRFKRDFAKAFFGQETGFLIVILSLPKENLKERISIRHNYDEEIIKWLIEDEGTEKFDPVDEHEERVINIVINDKMTKAEVANMILESVRAYCTEHNEFNHYHV